MIYFRGTIRCLGNVYLQSCGALGQIAIFFFPFPRFIIKNRSSRVGRSLWQAVVASFFMRFILTRGVLSAPACTCQHRSG